MANLAPLALLLPLQADGESEERTGAPHDPSLEVAVLVNEAVPESLAVGEHYRARRGIPAENVCRVRTSPEEEIDRATFRAEVLAPVRAFLETHPDVPMGVALKEAHGLAKLLASPKGEILGFHVVGPEASILLHQVVVAMRWRNHVSSLTGAITVHASLNEIVAETAWEVQDALPASARRGRREGELRARARSQWAMRARPPPSGRRAR